MANSPPPRPLSASAEFAGMNMSGSRPHSGSHNLDRERSGAVPPTEKMFSASIYHASGSGSGSGSSPCSLNMTMGDMHLNPHSLSPPTFDHLSAVMRPAQALKLKKHRLSAPADKSRQHAGSSTCLREGSGVTGGLLGLVLSPHTAFDDCSVNSSNSGCSGSNSVRSNRSYDTLSPSCASAGSGATESMTGMPFGRSHGPRGDPRLGDSGAGISSGLSVRVSALGRQTYISPHMNMNMPEGVGGAGVGTVSVSDR